MKTAVLISGELRFLEECLPTMKFINDDVDVYVSTWDKTVIKNDLLGIDINEDVTEDRIRAILPNATILIEPLECFESKKYSDRMIYKWQAGWKLIQNSGKSYDRLVITRSDMFFAPVSTFNYDDTADVEVIWNTKPGYLQDGLFKLSKSIQKDFFDRVTPNAWHTSENGDIHTWFYDEISSLNPSKIGNLFQSSQSIFCRPAANDDCRSTTFEAILKRQSDWRDSNSVMFALKHNSDFSLLLKPWGDQVTKDTILSYRSGRLRRQKRNTLLILAGVTRNYESLCLSLPSFGNVDLALCSWHDEASFRLKNILRIDHMHLSLKHVLDNHLDVCVKSKFHRNVEYMLHHLENALSVAQSSSHEKIIITRPDVLFLIESGILDVDKVTGLGMLHDSLTNSFSDLLWVLDRSVLSKMLQLPNTIRQLSIELQMDDIHHILALALARLEIEVDPQLNNQILNICIQRDSFQFLLDDEYTKEYFTAVKCDSAAWWRKTHKSRYYFSTKGL